MVASPHVPHSTPPPHSPKRSFSGERRQRWRTILNSPNPSPKIFLEIASPDSVAFPPFRDGRKGSDLLVGYRGSRSHFRNMIAAERPRPVAEAYLRLKTLPGEQAQVDWAHFGKVRIGRAQRRLMGFVMVLSYSRRTFLRFYLDAGMCNFQRGHIEAFEAWQGVPRELWYDNLKSVVLERRGAAIRFNPRILDFAGHYRFLPKPVAVARGNEKGRVERAIRYIRDSFFAARRWRDLDDLNAQAQAWCDGIAADRPWPEDRSIGVREAFERERGSLIALPGDPFTDSPAPVSPTYSARAGFVG